MPTIIPYKGKYPKIAKDAFIAENAVIIGDVEIGSKASIWYNCLLRGDVNYIKVGDETNVQDGTIVHVNRDNGPTLIGNKVTIGHMALLHACTIEDEAFIGMGAKVIDYSKVCSHAMIGAGALLSPKKSVATGQLWAGVPAKLLRELTGQEIEYIGVSAANYVALGQEYLKAQKNT